MRIFALSDPHLSLETPGKGMEIFGEAWRDHAARIAANWRRVVGADDLVLVPGDISWAMRYEGGAEADLEFLAALPGQKVLTKGNHDFWWETKGKLRSRLPAGMLIVQGDAVRVGRVAVGGTRLWDVPGLSFAALIDWRDRESGAPIAGEPIAAGGETRPPGGASAEHDLEIYKREVARLERALAALVRIAPENEKVLRIAITHYPPCSVDVAPSDLTARFEAAGVRHVVFGHLHSLRRPFPAPFFGPRNGVTYHLASADAIDFTPILIDEV